MKKIFLVFIALNFLFITTVPNQAYAVGGKIASKVAVKQAKELIIDTAVSEAMDIIFHKQMEDWLSNRYEVDEGFVPVCLDDKEKCDKPVQIKKTITPSDKEKLGEVIEQRLDTKMGNTGWIKFLDWIIPIIGIGMGLKWLEAELSPETESLFDEVAEESLIIADLMKPVAPKERQYMVDTTTKEPIVPPENPPSTTVETTTYQQPDFIQSQEVIFNSTKGTVSQFNMDTPEMLNGLQYMVVQRDITTVDPLYKTNSIYMDNGSFFMRIIPNSSYAEIYFDGIGNSPSGYRNAGYKFDGIAYKNGEISGYSYWEYNSHGGWTYSPFANLDLNTLKEIRSYPFTIETSSNAKRTSKYSTSQYLQKRVSFILNNGDVHDFYMSVQWENNMAANPSKFNYRENHSKNEATQLSLDLHVFNNSELYTEQDFNPTILDFPINAPLENTKYKNDNGTYTVLSPDVFPIHTPEGTPVKPDNNSSTGWTNSDTGEEIIVDEETLIVSDPVRTPDGIQTPDGTTIPEVPPNPSPEEQALNEGDFNGLGCETIKKPDFKPLETAITTSFPFSIPWDIYRIIEAVFGGMGSEKPVFDLNFDFLNGNSWSVTIPEFFDSWVPFAKTILLVTFDISLIYLFYRFTIGGEP